MVGRRHAEPLPILKTTSRLTMFLVCPSFYDGRLDGIGRVSGEMFHAMASYSGQAPYVLSANDHTAPLGGRAYGGRHARMVLDSLVLRPSPKVMKHRTAVVCTHLGLSPVARILARRWGVSWGVFLHGIEAWRPLPGRSRWGLKGAGLLMVNSIYTHRTFLRYNPAASPLPVRIVPLGVTADFRIPLMVTSRRSAERTEVLTVGRMSNADFYQEYRDQGEIYKGFKSCVLAVGRVRDRGIKIHLTIVGDGDARPEFEAWLQSRPERDIVTLTGRIPDEDLRQCYERSDVFLLPSEGEGFGLVFVEAMAFGLPAICVNAGAAPEIVDDEITGLVAGKRDLDDLSAKLQRLCEDVKLRSKLGAAARARFEARFTRDEFQRRLFESLRILNG